MKTINISQTHERGQSIVLIALMMAGLVAFVGLALDGGQVFEMRRQAQNAADAAALAGADELAEGQGALIWYRINQYAVGDSSFGNKATEFNAWYYFAGQEDNVVPIYPGIQPHPGTNCVRVKTSKKFDTLIISFLGFNTMTVNATGSACAKPVFPSVLWPIAVTAQTAEPYAFDKTVSLYEADQAPSGSNQFAWLSYNNEKSASDLEAKILNGYDGPFTVYNANTCNGGPSTSKPSLNFIPSCIRGTPGQKTAAEKTIASQLNKIVIVSFYDKVQGQQGQDTYYHIIGSGAFKITAVCLQNLNGNCVGGKRIEGQFVRYVANGQVCNENITLQCGIDGGLRTLRLTQ